MKVKRLISAILVFSICFILAISVSAHDLNCQAFVQLTASENSVASKGYFGHYGQGKISNHSASAGDAVIELQMSIGNGWVTYETVTVAPGGDAWTEEYGDSKTHYLVRVKISSSTYYETGNPGRIATGSVYTDYNTGYDDGV